ncbi:hypothetical protein KL929_004036 [Ogataea haglerorum]|uniref:uncharacterized protein n=1 Tax=Ogataea haglerorum TaxID=1937702 RepID=UPI001C89DC18|nr:uncharacterized protein KL911_004284 [Ogataea haglerorum]KAG7693935.1 hypothetical protein KL951_004414 [Ogataea haglerorum]KAG7715986.1 hypothetical protein KL913_003799 [Ogataea haglerorum]KAG7716448.1 hypothetical protein KL949_003739 [Ogataea haglerorum]KAG7746668.1 hypothetical protein KL912_004245 [Ogataea haglerorum]KAG7752038.1 hypothetical protein KL911_004284 [Ogataea haglerorum]
MIRLNTTPIEEIVGPAIAQVLPKHEKPWWRTKHLLVLNCLMLVPLLSSATAGYDGSLMNGLQSLQEWRDFFGNPHGTMLGFINAAQNCGCLIALPTVGWLTDRIGRKPVLISGLFGIIVATIIQATAFSMAQMIVARFIVGAAGMFAVQPVSLLTAELAYPSFRGKLTSLYWCMWYLGAILASWSCYGTSGRGDSWAWRIPTILQAGFPCVQLLFMWLVPESPRWLVSKGRISEARATLVKYHANGDDKLPLIDVEMTEIIQALDLEKEAAKSRWLDLVRTAGNRKRTYIALSVGVGAQWNGIAVVSYYLTLVLDTIGITSSDMQSLINGLLQIFNLLAAVTGALVVDRFGRRSLFLFSGIGMLISYIIWTACSAKFSQTGSKQYGRAVLGFIFIYYFHYDIAYTPLLLAYPTEIFPYHLRSKGITVELFGVYSALLIAAFCNSIAMDRIGWRYYIVFCCILGALVVNTYVFYPETKGYSLEEISRVFDGEDTVALVEDLESLKATAEHHDTV